MMKDIIMKLEVSLVTVPVFHISWTALSHCKRDMTLPVFGLVTKHSGYLEGQGAFEEGAALQQQFH